jgi:hypothetical protein
MLPIIMFCALTTTASNSIAELITVTSFFSIVQGDPRTYDPVNYPGRAVDYHSTILIDGAPPTNRLMILFSRDFIDFDLFNTPIGGLDTIDQSGNLFGFIGAANTNWLGMNAGESMNTPISGYSGGWSIYEDANNDGVFGVYDNESGFFTPERRLSSTWIDAAPYVVTTNISVKQYSPYPATGIGPLYEGQFTIFISNTNALYNTAYFTSLSLVSNMPSLIISNSGETIFVSLERSEDLSSTNWMVIANLWAGYTNYTDTTITNDPQMMIYRLNR